MGEQTWFMKDPGATLDYVWDWSAWLAGDTVASHVVAVSDPALVLESASHTDTAVTVWLSGGVEGVTYSVTCTIDTVGGRTDERTSRIRIRNR